MAKRTKQAMNKFEYDFSSIYNSLMSFRISSFSATNKRAIINRLIFDDGFYRFGFNKKGATATVFNVGLCCADVYFMNFCDAIYLFRVHNDQVKIEGRMGTGAGAVAHLLGNLISIRTVYEDWSSIETAYYRNRLSGIFGIWQFRPSKK